MAAAPPSWATTMLPWFVLANILVTLGVAFLLRVFAAGKWTEQQQHTSEEVRELREQIKQEHDNRRSLADETQIVCAKLALDIARHDERLKNLERRPDRATG